MAPEESYLFHGTSMRNFVSMMIVGAIKPASIGHWHVSLSNDRSVSEYWAKMAIEYDNDLFGADGRELAELEKSYGSQGVVIRFSEEALGAAGLDLAEFSDEVFGKGECDWESEIACPQRIPIELAEMVTVDRSKLTEFAKAMISKTMPEEIRVPRLMKIYDALQQMNDKFEAVKPENPVMGLDPKP